MRITIVVVVRRMVERGRIEIQILNPRVLEPVNQFALKLIDHCVPQIEAGKEFSRYLDWVLQERGLARVLQSRYPRSTSVKLLAGKTLVVVKGVDQHGHTQRIEHFSSRHVDIGAGGLLEVERDEIQIVIGVQNVAVKFDVAFDLQVLPRIQG